VKRTEALAHLEAHSILPQRVEQIAALQAHLTKHRDELAQGVLAAFRAGCREALDMQKRDRKGKIEHIHFTFYRHRVICEDPRIRICFYDAGGYLDPVACAVEYDAGWAFECLDAFERRLLQESRRYVHKIHAADVSWIKREEAAFYMQYVTNLIRHAMKEAVETEEFAELGKEETVYIRSGEYKDANDLVYRHVGSERSGDEVRRSLDGNEHDNYAYESFRRVDLSGMYFKLVNLCYTRFTQASLAGSLLVGCSLIGADFRGSDLTEANLEQSLIHGADFREANLYRAQLTEVQGSYVAPTEDEFQPPPFMETSFAQANLEQASFTGADLRGADFRGARLKDASFEGALLEGAKFLQRDIQALKLDKRQLDLIHRFT
jgi:BTB/POZ domain-containing protein KCTD9